ncbi:MAG: ATP-binding protein [Cyanobacteria bacterium]|nr:ATP-binding protein [Cyanobacteriota bacterium]
MKIAFVGKGGSGKSTLTSLFIRFLENKKDRDILAVDADINMNLAGLLGVTVPEEKLLARPDVSATIREHLRGTNKRIESIAKFLPTTPPGSNSNLIRNIGDKALEPYVVRASERPIVDLATVGTYDRDGIGQTCYHSHLFVVENLLSHTVSSDRFNVVCDMVAGTDAFAYSMHLQFDAIVLIAEPTPESIEVCRLYSGLAKEAGIDELIVLVGNKIEDQEDLDYICNSVGREMLSYVPSLSILKRARQKGQSVDNSLLTPEIMWTMQKISEKASNPAVTFVDRLRLLHELHLKLNAKEWVKLGYGDVSDQIDYSFNPLKELVVV